MTVVGYSHHIDLMLNELRRARIQAVDGLPAATPGNAGWLVFNVPDGRLYHSTGTAWRADTSVGGGTHEHVQAIPQSVVTVVHNLGFRPAVSAFALDYSQQYAEFQTQHLDLNTVRVSMDNPRACVLVMS